jgi:protein-S-isoprenylcysteine O-methyltransferase Ste14
LALANIRLKSAAPSTRDTLVSKGIYSKVRHPIHSGTFLEFFGIIIQWPSIQVAVSIAIGIIWIFLQSEFEERDLVKRIPEYKEYMIKVPRFLPALNKKYKK